MLAAASLSLAFASYAAAAPISGAVIAAVSNALQLPNTTQTNTATWYYQNGNAGACGLYSQDSDRVVGLPLEFYNDTGSVSTYCGSYIFVTNPKNNYSVAARVADASGANKALSLSVATWKALDGDASGLDTVTWRFANTTEAQAAKSSAAATAFTPASTPVAVEAAASSDDSSNDAPSTSSPKASPKPTSQYVAPSPTYVAPKTTQQASSNTNSGSSNNNNQQSSGGSGSYSGTATYFYQNGVAGACGKVNSDSSYIVALDSRMYGGGSHCGSQVKIYGNGKSITASVADECPTCVSSGSLDLSLAAFQALSSLDAGVVSITWSWA